MLNCLLQFFQTIQMENKKTPMEMLKVVTKNFFMPIAMLPPGAQETVAAAYLCLRAIDQVEDHPTLPNCLKSKILRNISFGLQKFKPEAEGKQEFGFDLEGQEGQLAEVSLRLADWLDHCPRGIRGRLADCTATMADRMAFWAQHNWKIENVQDLDVYCFAVAGAVGLLLCQVLEWFQGRPQDRGLAISFGRGLQLVNIIRNAQDDNKRGVSFYPPGWTQKQMIEHCKKNLAFTEAYIKQIQPGSIAKIFIQLPYALAAATISLIEQGKPQLTREQILELCKSTP